MQEGKDSGGGGVRVVSLDLYAEQVLLTLPHDESPTRIYLYFELWAKAVKQVRCVRKVYVHARCCEMGPSHEDCVRIETALGFVCTGGVWSGCGILVGRIHMDTAGILD